MRVPRYRIRTLLGVVAIVGVLVGLEIWRERRYRHFREMAAYHAGMMWSAGMVRVYYRDSAGGHMNHDERLSPAGEYHDRMRKFYESRW